MTEERLRSKKEIKRLFTNLSGKGITDDMMSRLIDVLWRNKYTMRTSGFVHAGGPDALIGFDIPTRSFSIKPLDPGVETYQPRFSFFTWNYSAEQQIRYEQEEIVIPDEEGLYVVYYDTDDDDRVHHLFVEKNPSELFLKTLYYSRVIISFLYWDAEHGKLLYFGDDRYGSEWIPQIHYYLHNAFHARRKNGLTLSGMVLNGNGSDPSHAKYAVISGTMLHDDFELEIPSAGGDNTIPILYKDISFPRFVETNGYGIYKGSSRICYNPGGAIFEADSGNYVLYHVFATNEIRHENRKVISVMGVAQYSKLADAYAGFESELDIIFGYMPHQGRLHIGTIIEQTDDSYDNTIKARIVGLIGEDHPPVSIEENSKEYLAIGEKQELQFKPYKEVNQPGHGFNAGQPIRHNGTVFTGAMADNAENAQTCGIVSEIIDADNFRYVSEGFLPGSWTSGEEYFLSPLASEMTTLNNPEIWEPGQVRQSLGWGTPHGLKIEIDVGDEIGEVFGNAPSEILTEMSLTGNGKTESKIHLVNDEDLPDVHHFYGTNIDQEKGFHPLPTENVQVLSGGAPVFDVSLGRGAQILLTVNTTISFTNLKANDTGHIKVLQDNVGGWDLSFSGASFEIAENAYQAANTVTLTGIANSKDIIAWWYDGQVINLAVIKNIQA